MLKFSFGILSLLFGISGFCQIINMESRRMHTDSVRRSGEFNTAFGYTSTNGADLLKLSGSGLLQVKSQSYKSL